MVVCDILPVVMFWYIRLKEFCNLSLIVDSTMLSCLSKVSVEHPHYRAVVAAPLLVSGAAAAVL